MEEKEKSQTKLTYEQLEQIAIQLQNKAFQAEAKLKSIDLVTTRLNYLFKVLENSQHFCESFVIDCGSEIIDLLKKEDPEKEKE